MGRPHLASQDQLRGRRGLAGIGAALGADVPLAWDPGRRPPVSAIEVYPAATLVARGFRAGGYKKPDQIEARREILASVAAELDVAAVGERAVGSDHLLDSVVCVLAGKDFLEGRGVGPAERGVAEREGWIWAGRGG